MKKIYLLASLFMVGLSAQAQRTLKLDFTISKPVFDTNIKTGTTVSYLYTITNNSATAADSVQTGDTVMFFDPSCKYDASLTTPLKFTSYVYFVASSKIAKGSSINVSPSTPLAFADIETLADPSASLGYKTKPFTNNKQYAWFVVFYGISKPAANIAIAGVSGNPDTGRIWINKTTSVNELKLNGVVVKTYPNPAVNQLSVEYPFADNNKATVTVADVNGRTVLVKELENTAGTSKFDLDVTAVPSGMYFLRINAGDQSGIAKFDILK